MPSRATHHAKAASNISFYKSIDATKYGDWAVTALFYAALHLADACMDPTVHPNSHADRNSFFPRFHELRNVFRHYRQLQDDSRDARYNPPTNFDATTVRELARNHYEPIRVSTLAVLGNSPDCSTTPPTPAQT